MDQLKVTKRISVFIVMSLLSFAQASMGRDIRTYFSSEVSSLRGTNFEGYVEISPGRYLYVRQDVPEGGAVKGYVDINNGLTFNTLDNTALADALLRRGYGVIRKDDKGMGKTMLRDPSPSGPIPIQDQAADTLDLLRLLGFSESNPVHVFGLSYGGGKAIEILRQGQGMIGEAFSDAPYTEPVGMTHKQVSDQVSQHEFVRHRLPSVVESFERGFLRSISLPHIQDDLGVLSLEEQRDKLYSAYLYLHVVGTYHLFETNLLNILFTDGIDAFKKQMDSIYFLVEGIRKWQSRESAKQLPDGRLNLIAGTADEYVPLETLVNFWETIPERVHSTFVQIQAGRHKNTGVENWPDSMAAWMDLVITDKKKLLEDSSNRAFLLNPVTGVLRRAPDNLGHVDSRTCARVAALSSMALLPRAFKQ